MSDIYDIIIVGAGPGGLAAGLYASRAKLKNVVLEKELPGGQINKTGFIEDYPGFSSIDARELAEKMLAHAKEVGAQIKSTDATAVRKKGDLFEVETSEGVLKSKDDYSGLRRQSELSQGAKGKTNIGPKASATARSVMDPFLFSATNP